MTEGVFFTRSEQLNHAIDNDTTITPASTRELLSTMHGTR